MIHGTHNAIEGPKNANIQIMINDTLYDRKDAKISVFDSGYLDPYQSYTLSFDKSGTYDYFCTLHPWMKAQIIVE